MNEIYNSAPIYTYTPNPAYRPYARAEYEEAVRRDPGYEHQYTRPSDWSA